MFYNENGLYAALNNYSLNSAPTDITLSATAFNENISSGTNIASLTATDSDNGDSDFHPSNWFDGQ